MLAFHSVFHRNTAVMSASCTNRRSARSLLPFTVFHCHSYCLFLSCGVESRSCGNLKVMWVISINHSMAAPISILSHIHICLLLMLQLFNSFNIFFILYPKSPKSQHFAHKQLDGNSATDRDLLLPAIELDGATVSWCFKVHQIKYIQWCSLPDREVFSALGSTL